MAPAHKSPARGGRLGPDFALTSQGGGFWHIADPLSRPSRRRIPPRACLPPPACPPCVADSLRESELNSRSELTTLENAIAIPPAAPTIGPAPRRRNPRHGLARRPDPGRPRLTAVARRPRRRRRQPRPAV